VHESPLVAALRSNSDNVDHFVSGQSFAPPEFNEEPEITRRKCLLTQAQSMFGRLREYCGNGCKAPSMSGTARRPGQIQEEHQELDSQQHFAVRKIPPKRL